MKKKENIIVKLLNTAVYAGIAYLLILLGSDIYMSAITLNQYLYMLFALPLLFLGVMSIKEGFLNLIK